MKPSADFGSGVIHEKFLILLRLFYRPLAAMNDLLDHGSLAVAIALAVAVSVAVQLPSRMAAPQPMSHPVVAVQQPVTEDDDDAPGLPARFTLLSVAMGLLYPVGFATLAALAGVFVPVLVVAVARMDGLGSAGVAFRRDYLPVLTCVLTAWGACYLPYAVCLLAQPAFATPAALAGHVYFLFLSVCALRTAMGTAFGKAIAAVAVGWVLAAVSLSMLAGMFYMLASPFYLYWAYRILYTDINLTLGGLSSRQSLKRQLEIATLNPRDADAQYQLGLIYLQRRNYEAAIPHFQKAIEIDATEAGSYYELGRIAREQGRLEDAEKFLQRAASLDDKHSSSEVLRDCGAVSFQLSHLDDALRNLDAYTQRRPYDPEGLYFHALTLRKLGRENEARQGLAAVIEAVNTAPQHRRRQVSKWKSQAERELRQ